MTTIVSMFLLSLAWIAGGAFTIRCRLRWLNPPRDYLRTEREFGHWFMGGILWPIYLPFLTIWALGMGKIKPQVPKLRKSLEQKVLEYSETPLLVLAQIIAQRIAAYPEGLDYYTWTSPDKRIVVKFNPYSSPFSLISKVTVDKKDHTLCKKGASAVIEAAKRADKFNRDKAEADAKAAAQLKALEAVESLLLAPESVSEEG